MCLGVFIWYFSAHRTFVWSHDGWNQHYKALVYYGKYLRRILRTLASTGKLVIPAWDFSLGEGSDILSALHYYVIGDPLDLLAVAFPTRYMWVLYGGLILLRLYLSGLFFSVLCFHTGVKNRYGVLAGALSYAFCSWAVYNSARHPYFLNPMVYLPLLILGVERYLERKKPWLLIGAVFLSAVSNFYFFYMLALTVAVYTIVRLLLLYPKQIGKAFWQGIQLAVHCILGVLLAAFILLPVILTFLGSNRMEVQNGRLLLYPLKHYLTLPLSFLTTSSTYWTIIGLSVLTIPALWLLFRRKKEYPLLKILFCICIVILLVPFLGQVTNGFSYITNRWCWGFALLCAYILAVMWPSLVTLSRDDLKYLVYCSIGTFGYVAFCRFMDFSATEAAVTSVSLIFIYLCLLALGSLSLQRRQYTALLLTVVSICIHSYYRNAPSAGNYAAESVLSKDVSQLTHNETEAVKAATELEKFNEFYRYSGRSLTHNAGMIAGLSSTNYYWSIANPAVSSFRSMIETAEPQSYNYKGYDDCSALLSLAGVRYFVVPSTDTAPAPYGFTQIESTHSPFKEYKVYQNEHALPLAYTYANAMAESDWEKLNAVERQEALLQTVVLDDELVQNTTSPRLTSHTVNYSVKCGKNVTQEGSRFVVTAAKSTVTLSFDGLSDSETYLNLTGLYYSGFSPYALNQLNNTPVISLSNRFGLFRKQILWREPNSLTLTFKTSSKISKKLSYLTPYNNCYSGRHNFAICLDYSEEPVTSVTITFPQSGVYSFDSLNILCQPMNDYAAQVDALAQDTLQNLTFGTDQLSGNISLQENKWLCFAIPYSSGWKAYVDGEEVELSPANIQYMALHLPAGEHSVELRYNPPFLKAGFCISGITGLVLIGMFVFYRKKEGAQK